MNLSHQSLIAVRNMHDVAMFSHLWRSLHHTASYSKGCVTCQCECIGCCSSNKIFVSSKWNYTTILSNCISLLRKRLFPVALWPREQLRETQSAKTFVDRLLYLPLICLVTGNMSLPTPGYSSVLNCIVGSIKKRSDI